MSDAEAAVLDFRIYLGQLGQDDTGRRVHQSQMPMRGHTQIPQDITAPIR